MVESVRGSAPGTGCLGSKTDRISCTVLAMSQFLTSRQAEEL